MRIFKYLLSETQHQLIVFIRALDEKEANRKYADMLLRAGVLSKIESEYRNRVELIWGDISEPLLGLNVQEYEMICKSINEIFHIGALTSFNCSLDRLRHVNLIGTKNMMDLAMNCIELNKFNYISTVFVAGNYGGIFTEDDLFVNQDFNNYYEQSKFEAEDLINQYYKQNLIVLTFRPGVICGDWIYGDGNINGLLYQFIHLLHLELIEYLPIAPFASLNILPCDVAAEMICILSKMTSMNNTYHIISEKNTQIDYLTHFFCNNIPCRAPKVLDFNDRDPLRLSPVQNTLLKPFMPYLKLKTEFSFEKTRNVLVDKGFLFHGIGEEYLLKMISFSRRTGLIKN